MNSINIQEAITILGGITGIVIAILWIAGRFYAEGYFSAMNIPSFQINLSIWEYAELSWLNLIFFFLRKLYPILVVAGAIVLILPPLAFAFQAIFPRFRVFDLSKSIGRYLISIPSSVRYVLTFVTILYFSYLFLQALIDINQRGQIAGKNVVFTNSYAVDVYSNDYLPLGTPITLPNTAPSVLRYRDLRLLAFNNGKYYLFRDINPETCKPAQVFIVPDTPDIRVVLSAIAPVTPCAMTTPVASEEQ